MPDISQLLEKYSFLVFADRISDLKQKYPLLSTKIDYLANRDPSGNQKYLEYAVKVLASGKALENEIADVIGLFHKYLPRLEKKDINAYPNFTELRDLLFSMRDIKTTKEKREIKASGAEKKYEDEQVLVLRVKDKGAACFYGAGTKWCITMSTESYFEEYDAANVIFYFLLRKDLEQDDPLYKVAVVFQRNEDNEILKVQYFDARDNEIGENAATGGLFNWEKIYSVISSEAESVKKGMLAKLMGPEINEIPPQDVKKYLLNLDHPVEIVEKISGNRHANSHIIDILVDIMLEKASLNRIKSFSLKITQTNYLSLESYKKIRPLFFVEDLATLDSYILSNPKSSSKLLELVVNLTDLKLVSNYQKKQDIFNLSINPNVTSQILLQLIDRMDNDSIINLERLYTILTSPKAEPIVIEKILNFYPLPKFHHYIYDSITGFGDKGRVWQNPWLVNKLVSRTFNTDMESDIILEHLAWKAKELTPENWDKLVNSGIGRTRMMLAHNPNAPTEILNKLMTDNKIEVIRNLIFNKNFPIDQKIELFLQHKNEFNKSDLINLKERIPEIAKLSFNNQTKIKTAKKEEKISLEQVKKLPYKSLKRMLDNLRAFLKKDGVMQEVFKEHDVDIECIDYIPMMFGDIDTSAKTDHGVIIFSYKLLTDGDFFKDFSYGIHEITHALQQCYGDKPTKSSDDGNYLDNEFEQSAFQNQIKYISEIFDEDEAEEYTDNLLKHHDIKGKEKAEKKDLLMDKVNQ